jgi:hypothetical protein
MATYGARFRDPATNAVLVTIDTRMTKSLGQFDTGTTPGSVTDGNLTALAGATPWFTTLPGFGSGGKDSPTIVVSGNTISWSWKYAGTEASRSSARVVYGVYTQ